jgi:hypothetical protein
MKNPACEAVLTMRRTGLGLGFGVGKDDPDFVVYSGEWQIGRIYKRRGFPDYVRWVWSLYGVVLTRPPGINTDGHATTLEAAKAEFAGRSRHRPVARSPHSRTVRNWAQRGWNSPRCRSLSPCGVGGLNENHRSRQLGDGLRRRRTWPGAPVPDR